MSPVCPLSSFPVFLPSFQSFFSLSVLNISSHSLLVCKISAETFADSLIKIPSYVMILLCLAAFKIPFSSLIFESLIIMCLSEDLFGLNLFGDL